MCDQGKGIVLRVPRLWLTEEKLWQSEDFLKWRRCLPHTAGSLPAAVTHVPRGTQTLSAVTAQRTLRSWKSREMPYLFKSNSGKGPSLYIFASNLDCRGHNAAAGYPESTVLMAPMGRGLPKRHGCFYEITPYSSIPECKLSVSGLP